MVATQNPGRMLQSHPWREKNYLENREIDSRLATLTKNQLRLEDRFVNGMLLNIPHASCSYSPRGMSPDINRHRFTYPIRSLIAVGSN